MLFSDWSTLWHTLAVGVLAYVGIVFWLRISGKRTLSQWNAFDAIITFALGSMLATVVLSSTTSLAQGLVGFALLVALQFVVTFLAVRFPFVRRLVKARPTLLLHRGLLLHEALERERVTESEILAALREKGLASVGEAYAIVLETSGKFSVIENREGDDFSALEDVEGMEIERR